MKHELTALRLKYAMAATGIRPVELSEQSGVSQASISQYMSGTHCPSRDSASKLAKVLGVNPVWLIGFDVPMTLEGASPEKAANEMLDIAQDGKLLEALKIYKIMPKEEQERVLNIIHLFAPKQSDDTV